MISLLKTLSEMMRGKPIRAERVYLRPPHRRDWRSWARVRGESRDFLTPWEPTWPADALTRKAFLRRLRAYAMHSAADTGYTFFVFRATDHRLMGGISLNNVRRGVAQTCSVGYWIGEAYSRQGYMSEALSAVIAFAFEALRVHRLEAACLPNNEPSQKLLRRVGFREEGYARSYLRINGHWRDHVQFAMVNTDPRPVISSRFSEAGGRAPKPGRAADHANEAAFAGDRPESPYPERPYKVPRQA